MFKLNDASIIIDTAIAEARARSLAPLAVAVLDAGGHLVAYKREDGAGIVRFDISEGVDSVTVTAEVPGMEENDFFWDRLLGTFRPHRR